MAERRRSNAVSCKDALRSVCDITPQLLEKLGVCGLLLDIDNTLTTHDNPVPAAGVEAWVAGMQAAGISLCLVSNNHPPRVEPFAKRLGLDFVCEGKKPLTKGYREAVQKMGLSRKEVAAVGDQIFTDVLGANLFGVPCIFVFPMEMEKTRFFGLRCNGRRLSQRHDPYRLRGTAQRKDAAGL
ncbi:MAG: YqeG family HAD IIIA-type phosphatase [Ruminococcus callidus]